MRGRIACRNCNEWFKPEEWTDFRDPLCWSCAELIESELSYGYQYEPTIRDACRNAFYARCDFHWPADSTEPNLMRVIASCRGWNQIQVGETMTVHFDGEEYKIVRKE